jgi:hypothetical protein
MSEHIERTIQDLQVKLQTQEQDVIETKRMINSLRGFLNQPPLFTEDQLGTKPSLGGIRADTFYGQPLATAVRMYLEMRRATGQGPATVADIYDALLRGGYAFQTTADNAKRILRISLSKNTAMFHKLPHGNVFGLLSWYPDVKPRRSKIESAEESSTDEEELEESDSSNIAADEEKATS